MKLEELITDMKAAGCNDNTMQLARNFYLCGQKDEREACAVLLDENAKRCSENSMAQMILYANATAIRARGQE